MNLLEVMNMKIYKAYKFRMYPDKEQKIKINQNLGSSRFVYNYYLNKKDETYKKNKEILSFSDLKKDLLSLQVNYPWLKEVDGCAIRTALEDLDRAYLNFFQKGNGFPKYKKKSFHEKYRTVCIRGSYYGKSYANIKVDLEKRVIKLPKIDEIRIRGYRKLKEFPYKIMNATIEMVADRYYVSVLVEEERPNIKIIPTSIVGIDLGVKDLVITSDGVKYKAMTKITTYEKKIKGFNKALARSIKGSNNRRKLVIKIERVYQKLRNMRKYYIHLITSKLVKENDMIVTEDLSVKKMIEEAKVKHFSSTISNSSLSEIIRQIDYKAKWNGKIHYKVDKYYASSQICSHCGHRNREVRDLSIREWICEECENRNDRDINASMNLLEIGLKYYMEEYIRG